MLGTRHDEEAHNCLNFKHGQIKTDDESDTLAFGHLMHVVPCLCKPSNGSSAYLSPWLATASTCEQRCMNIDGLDEPGPGLTQFGHPYGRIKLVDQLIVLS